MKTLSAKNYWHNREFAIYGTTCDHVQQIFVEVDSKLDRNLVFVDASHTATDNSQNNFTTFENGFSEFTDSPINSCTLSKFQGAIINGNHHRSSAQVIVVNNKKRESLLRRVHELNHVVAVVTTSDLHVPDYIEPFVSPETIVLNYERFISEFVKSFFDVPKIKMLILAGGMSKRMGEDKALIRYQNQIQLNRILQMSAELNLPSYLSVRSNQSHWGEEFGVEVIEDILINAGPVSGIVSAMKSDANCAWLVVACDLPLLSSTDLKLLIESRDSQKIATCFQAPIDGGPEPLCTIWEPEAINPLLNWWAKGVNCPRKTLFNSNVKIIKPNDNSVLFNANTPEEREEVKSKL